MAVPGGGRGSAAGRRRSPSRSCRGGVHLYFGALNDRSQSSFQMSRTPLTADPLTSAFDDQTSGIAAAVATIIVSTWPHALSRAVGLVIFEAASIAALIFGSFSTAQLELLTGTIALPLNGTYS